MYYFKTLEKLQQEWKSRMKMFGSLEIIGVGISLGLMRTMFCERIFKDN